MFMNNMLGQTLNDEMIQMTALIIYATQEQTIG
jgi:hypothetical protein